MTQSHKPWIVLKFGGTSVASPQTWQSIYLQSRQRCQEGYRPMVVCSALSKVTNRLEELITLALQEKHQAPLRELYQLHLDLMAQLHLECNGHDLLQREFDTLKRLLNGLALTGENTPRLKARILAQGELMSTRIGAAYLNAQGLRTQWLDARTLLQSATLPQASVESTYLSALCLTSVPKPLESGLTPLEAQIAQLTAAGQSEPEVYLTQGFIASNSAQETVLLGRGGSDVSASYLGALLPAQLVEFWTDVPGMYTADPHRIPQARLLTSLNYAEAQELASVGAKVLHPRSLKPLQEANIPIDIRCTLRPNLKGTHISSELRSLATVKAVAARSHVVLISLEDIGMWQQVGFLAKAFASFAQYGLSIDLVATSQTNVTVSLDVDYNLVDSQTLQALCQDLSRFCHPHIISPCATISLVGTKIRSILHKLGPALELFEEERVHLLSQASSDLNLTFVVDEKQAERLVGLLHSQLFSGNLDSTIYGPSWREDFTPSAYASNATSAFSTWWQSKRSELLSLAEATPVYVYDQETLSQSARKLLSLQAVNQVMYAMKANANPELLRLFQSLGTGFECVSCGELRLLRELFPTLDKNLIIFTPNFAQAEDYRFGFEQKVNVTLDNAAVLDYWPEVFRGQEVLLRLDLGHGVGHSRKVRTAGSYSKFGIPLYELAACKAKLEALDVKVIGLHSHSGSGIKTADTWARSALALAQAAEQFPQCRILDLGGGLGVPERPEVEVLDLSLLDQQLELFKQSHPQYSIWIEPGRFLVAQAGVLLASVTQIKEKAGQRFVGLNAGMNNLIRPALYGAYHEIVNLTRINEPATTTYDVVGPICETGDILGRERRLAPSEPGDVMLIATAGAYGQAMSSNYNLRGAAQEILL